MVVEADDTTPIILDMGTGMRGFGDGWGSDPFSGTVLLSHLHWDHVQGLPFFAPVHNPASSLVVYGPAEGDRSLGEHFQDLMKPPYFPICCSDMFGDVRFEDASSDTFEVGAATIMSRPVPHVGETNGYRIDVHGWSIAYIPDHQQPEDTGWVDPGVLELCDGVDLLIHDAQYTPEQFTTRSDWGHCTMAYACEVARQAGAKTLAMFHHDPANTDEILTKLVEENRRVGQSMGLTEVFGAAEGESIKFG